MRRFRGIVFPLLMLAGLVLLAGCFLLPNRPPTAAFTVEYNVTTDPLIVDLDATTSSDPDGDDIVSYMWTFEDPGVDILTPLATFTGVAHVAEIRVRFVEEGQHTVTLLVVDERGAMSETAVSIDVIVPTP